MVLLCIALIAAGAALMYMDMSRDFRHGVYRCENGRMMEEPAEPDADKIQTAGDSIGLLLDRHPDVQQYMMLVPSAACIQSGWRPYSRSESGPWGYSEASAFRPSLDRSCMCFL